MPGISFAPPPQAGVNIQICATSGTTGDCAQGASNTNVAAPPGTGGFPTPVEPEPPVEPSADGGVENDGFVEVAANHFVDVEIDPTYAHSPITPQQVHDLWRFSGQEGAADRAVIVSAMAAAHAALIENGTPIPEDVADAFWNLEVRWIGTNDGGGEELRTALSAAIYLAGAVWITGLHTRLLEGEFQTLDEFREEMRQTYNAQLQTPLMGHTLDNETSGTSLDDLFPDFLSLDNVGLGPDPPFSITPMSPSTINASCPCPGNEAEFLGIGMPEPFSYPGIYVTYVSGSVYGPGLLNGDTSLRCVGALDVRSCSVDPAPGEQCSTSSKFSSRKHAKNIDHLNKTKARLTCRCPGEGVVYGTVAARTSCASPAGTFDKLNQEEVGAACKEILQESPCTAAKALAAIIFAALLAL